MIRQRNVLKALSEMAISIQRKEPLAQFGGSAQRARG